MFTNQSQLRCLSCNRQRYNSSNNKPVRSIQYLSLSQQLALLVYHHKLRQDLKYRHNYKHYGNFDDIFSGSHYTEMVDRQLFTNEFDIACGLYVDGFQSSSKSGTLTLVHLVVFNYHPSIRYVNKQHTQNMNRITNHTAIYICY
jgi:hypothetical protein